jgi:hypothetical protein
MITAVTSPDVVVDLRPSALAAVFYAASLVIAAALVITVVGMDGDVPFTVFFLVFVAGIVGVNTATVLSRVRARADGSLEVRNRFSTRRLQRSDVDRVIQGRRAGVGSARRIELLLTDGRTVPLIATETPPLPGLGQRMEQQAEQLRAWMTDTPTPYR